MVVMKHPNHNLFGNEKLGNRRIPQHKLNNRVFRVSTVPQSRSCQKFKLKIFAVSLDKRQHLQIRIPFLSRTSPTTVNHASDECVNVTIGHNVLKASLKFA